jgi:hypothetical protein
MDRSCCCRGLARAGLFLRSFDGQMIGGAICQVLCVEPVPHGTWLRVVIFFAVLVVAIDLTANDGNWLRTLVASSNALMLKVGPI